LLSAIERETVALRDLAKAADQIGRRRIERRRGSLD
jgi:hypothetical protein